MSFSFHHSNGSSVNLISVPWFPWLPFPREIPLLRRWIPQNSKRIFLYHTTLPWLILIWIFSSALARSPVRLKQQRRCLRLWLRVEQWIWPTIAYGYASNNSSWLARLELTANENTSIILAERSKVSHLMRNIATFNNVTTTMPSLHNFLIPEKKLIPVSCCVDDPIIVKNNRLLKKRGKIN